ncbi:hypothetical protein A2U01_0065562 [Trifolium medium]|uniref:Uncharacterized protein n=1 Tax=Trifolium medium TaxID=97028 RepID=A0A392S5V0_9FABA|nr:hypothetical protein [Trifolium medium]
MCSGLGHELAQIPSCSVSRANEPARYNELRHLLGLTRQSSCSTQRAKNPARISHPAASPACSYKLGHVLPRIYSLPRITGQLITG